MSWLGKEEVFVNLSSKNGTEWLLSLNLSQGKLGVHLSGK
jgi:hypothetical protein